MKQAIIKNNKSSFAKLLYLSGSVNAMQEENKTALMLASELGKDDIVDLLLLNPDIDINSKGNYGKTALILAAKRGNESIVAKLIARPEIKINESGEDLLSALCEATKNNHSNVVKILLNNPEINVNSQGVTGKTVLIWAAEKGYDDIVTMLLSDPRIQINDTDIKGNTALITAARNGHSIVVKNLLKQDDINVHTKNRSGESALDLFPFKKIEDADVLREFLSKGAKTTKFIPKHISAAAIITLSFELSTNEEENSEEEIESADENSKQAEEKIALRTINIKNPGKKFLKAAEIGYYQMVKEMLEGSPSINVNFLKNNKRNTALILASGKGHFEIVKELLQRPDIDVNIISKEKGQTAFDLFNFNDEKDAEILELFLKKCATLTKEKFIPQHIVSIALYRLIETKCHYAVKHAENLGYILEDEKMPDKENSDQERILEDLCIDINSKDINGDTALIRAAAQEKISSVISLLKAPEIDPNAQNIAGKTALMEAAENGNIDIINTLLSSPNININMRDKDGDSALTIAAWKKNKEAVAALLNQKSINVNLLNNGEETAFDIFEFSELEDAEILEIFLQKAACTNCKPKNIPDNILVTALQNLEEKQDYSALGNASMLGYRLTNKLRKKVQTYSENKLIFAAKNGDTRLVELLLKNNTIDINETNQDGNTALMLASEKKHIEIIEMFLSSPDIEVNIKNKSGRTAIGLLPLLKYDDHKIISMFLQKGAVAPKSIPKLIMQKAIEKIPFEQGEKARTHEENIIHDLDNAHEQTSTKKKFLNAARAGNFDYVASMIKSNIINETDEQGNTALILASSQRHIDIIKMLLLEPKIDANIKNMYGNKAIDIFPFMDKADSEVLELFLQKKVTPTKEIPWFIMSEAIKSLNAKEGCKQFIPVDNSKDPIKVLNTKEKKKEIKQEIKKLKKASRNGNVRLVKDILENEEIDINAMGKGKNSLMFAAERGNTEVVRTLISSPKININVRDKNKRTPLMLASQIKNIAIVKMLLNHPQTDIHAKDVDNKTAFELIRFNDRYSIILLTMFLKKEAVTKQSIPQDIISKALTMLINQKDTKAVNYAKSVGMISESQIQNEESEDKLNKQQQNEKNLIRAVEKRNCTKVKTLISLLEININCRDSKRRTPLIIAAMTTNADMIKTLLECTSINVNLRDEKDQTALIIAAKTTSPKIIEMLVKHPGIDINARDEKGSTPIMHAAKTANLKAIKILLCHPELDIHAKDIDGKTAFDMIDFSKKDANSILELFLQKRDATKRYLAISVIEKNIKNLTQKQDTKPLKYSNNIEIPLESSTKMQIMSGTRPVGSESLIRSRYEAAASEQETNHTEYSKPYTNNL